MYICETPPRKDHPVHGSDLQKIIDLIARHALGTPVKLGCFDEAASSSGGDPPPQPKRSAQTCPMQSGPRRSLRLVWQSSLLTNVPRGSSLTT